MQRPIYPHVDGDGGRADTRGTRYPASERGLFMATHHVTPGSAHPGQTRPSHRDLLVDLGFDPPIPLEKETQVRDKMVWDVGSHWFEDCEDLIVEDRVDCRVDDRCLLEQEAVF